MDVQQQLAYQYKRFQTFDREFVKLMREMKRDPSVLYWVKHERGLFPRLESYHETLNGIQKALGEYLEKQRSRFPRFYFVGTLTLHPCAQFLHVLTQVTRICSRLSATPRTR